MKKIILTMLIALTLGGGAAFADHPDRLGLGGSFSGALAYADDIDLFYSSAAGLSLKAPVLPVYWAFYWNYSYLHTGLGLTADFYAIDKPMVAREMTNEDGSYDLKLDWYLGIGLFADTLFWDGGATAFDIGLRVPVGVSWHIIREVELCIAVGPAGGIFAGSDIDLRPYFFGFSEVIVRYWFK